MGERSAPIGVWGRTQGPKGLRPVSPLDVFAYHRAIRTIHTGVHAERLTTSINLSLGPSITVFFTSVGRNLLSIADKDTTAKDAAIEFNDFNPLLTMRAWHEIHLSKRIERENRFVSFY